MRGRREAAPHTSASRPLAAEDLLRQHAQRLDPERPARVTEQSLEAVEPAVAAEGEVALAGSESLIAEALQVTHGGGTELLRLRPPQRTEAALSKHVVVDGDDTLAARKHDDVRAAEARVARGSEVENRHALKPRQPLDDHGLEKSATPAGGVRRRRLAAGAFSPTGRATGGKREDHGKNGAEPRHARKIPGFRLRRPRETARATGYPCRT